MSDLLKNGDSAAHTSLALHLPLPVALSPPHISLLHCCMFAALFTDFLLLFHVASFCGWLIVLSLAACFFTETAWC